ncbi:MAG TPA: lysophospholipid acyltransferase family protein [Candidatus Limnocylindria bacterium]|jgi:1-acyl-sn-glycerol-3-phosphate acyltransferase|nr:lysophospholipid acyltransferase family protein [Candidatus Limnocylindria bacterium]
MPRHPFRVAGRFLHFLWFCASALADFGLKVRPAEKKLGRRDYRIRAEWSHRHAKRLCQVLNLRVEAVGPVPSAQFLCSNHLGYLDIVTLVAVAPMVFVSKAEVRGWPIIGWLTQCAGTIYLQRERKGDLIEVARQFDPVLEHNVPVVMFLEGTSSGGDTVLPFRPSLLAPAVGNGWQVAPVGLDYSVSEGTVAEDVAYWRDMTFFPHFVNLLGKSWLGGRVAFGAVRDPGADRKILAQELHGTVVALRRPH